MSLDATRARTLAHALFGSALLVFLCGVYVGLIFYENTLGIGAEFVAQLDFSLWVILFSGVLGFLLVAMFAIYLGTDLPETVPVLSVPAPASASAPPSPARPVRTLPVTLVPPARAPARRPEPVRLPPIVRGRAEPADAGPRLVQCTWCGTHFPVPQGSQPRASASCPQCRTVVVFQTGPARLESASDSVLELEGITHEMTELLHAARIFTLAQLRRANPSDLSNRTGIPVDLVEGWRRVADVARIPAIASAEAHLLSRAGFHSAAAVARSSPKEVWGQIHAYLSSLPSGLRPVVSLPEVVLAQWIAAAQTVAEQDAAAQARAQR